VNNSETVQLLLEEDGIDLNPKDNNGRTPLLWAAGAGNFEMVRLLAQRDRFALHKLIREKKEPLVRLLLDGKYDVNTRDALGNTPVHIAISCRHVEMATILISFNKTDINLEDSDGRTPLRLAIQIKCHGLIKLLLEKSALVKNIMVDEWRGAYGKQASDIVLLSERDSQEKSVCFIAEEESAQISTESGADRRLL
jgi:ankyrin repeat protein